MLHRGRVRVVVNLSGSAQEVPLDGALAAVLLTSAVPSAAAVGSDSLQLGPEAVAIVEVAGVNVSRYPSG